MKINQIDVFYVSQFALDTNLNPTGPPLSSSWVASHCVNANKNVPSINLYIEISQR